MSSLTFRATPHNVCKFVTLVGSVILKDTLVNLEILVNRNVADVRYLPADNEKRDLVVCTPPVYRSVRWQNVILAAHVYSQSVNSAPNSVDFLLSDTAGTFKHTYRVLLQQYSSFLRN